MFSSGDLAEIIDQAFLPSGAGLCYKIIYAYAPLQLKHSFPLRLLASYAGQV